MRPYSFISNYLQLSGWELTRNGPMRILLLHAWLTGNFGDVVQIAVFLPSLDFHVNAND